MKLFLIAILTLISAEASDVTVSSFVQLPGPAIGASGMIDCDGVWCIWNSNTNLLGLYEIYGAKIATPNSIICISCGQDTQLGYTVNTVNWGQPRFDGSGNLALSASNPAYWDSTQTPGAAVGGADTTIWSFSDTTGSITFETNVTSISSAIQGVLYGRFCNGNLFISYRYAAAGSGVAHSGKWEARAYSNYATSPSEITAVRTNFVAAYPGNYAEASGDCDAWTGEFLYQVATGSTLWQQSFVGINAAGNVDVVVNTTTNSCNDWVEHASIFNGVLIWSSSHNVPLALYNPCAATFLTVGLDKWETELTHTWNGTRFVLGADIGNMRQLTFFNQIGNPDRDKMCLIQLGATCSGNFPTLLISGGYSSSSATFGTLYYLVKYGAGNGTDFIMTFTLPHRKFQVTSTGTIAQ